MYFLFIAYVSSSLFALVSVLHQNILGFTLRFYFVFLRQGRLIPKMSHPPRIAPPPPLFPLHSPLCVSLKIMIFRVPLPYPPPLSDLLKSFPLPHLDVRPWRLHDALTFAANPHGARSSESSPFLMSPALVSFFASCTRSAFPG